MIDNINGYIETLVDNSYMYSSSTTNGVETKNMRMKDSFIGELYCPCCGANRKHNIARFTPYIGFDLTGDYDASFNTLPIIHKYKCLQCGKGGVLVLYEGPENLELAVLRDTYGGNVTPNTPTEVKYYLDQAYRARMVSALTASMAMYRTALEWILYEQGYEEGMLSKKISNLEKDIKNGTAPEWANSLPVQMITGLKNIGNGAVHTNNGDIKKQNEIDKNLLEFVDIIFAELLDVIYEQPIRRKENLDKLKAIENKFAK